MMNDIFFSFVTGGVWDQKTSQLMAQNLSAWLVGAGDSSVSLSALLPSPHPVGMQEALNNYVLKNGHLLHHNFSL